MTADLINGLFEVGGACAVAMSIGKLIKDRKYSGFHWGTTVFFQSWGVWNLYFYSAIDKPFSFAGGACLALANTVYLGLLWRFRERQYDSGVFE